MSQHNICQRPSRRRGIGLPLRSWPAIAMAIPATLLAHSSQVVVVKQINVVARSGMQYCRKGRLTSLLCAALPRAV
jgi:hypothetical protein